MPGTSVKLPGPGTNTVHARSVYADSNALNASVPRLVIVRCVVGTTRSMHGSPVASTTNSGDALPEGWELTAVMVTVGIVLLQAALADGVPVIVLAHRQGDVGARRGARIVDTAGGADVAEPLRLGDDPHQTLAGDGAAYGVVRPVGGGGDRGRVNHVAGHVRRAVPAGDVEAAAIGRANLRGAQGDVDGHLVGQAATGARTSCRRPVAVDQRLIGDGHVAQRDAHQ